MDRWREKYSKMKSFQTFCFHARFVKCIKVNEKIANLSLLYLTFTAKWAVFGLKLDQNGLECCEWFAFFTLGGVLATVKYI